MDYKHMAKVVSSEITRELTSAGKKYFWLDIRDSEFMKPRISVLGCRCGKDHVLVCFDGDTWEDIYWSVSCYLNAIIDYKAVLDGTIWSDEGE